MLEGITQRSRCVIVTLTEDSRNGIVPIHTMETVLNRQFMLDIPRRQHGISRSQILEHFFYYKLLEQCNPRYDRGFARLRTYEASQQITTSPEWRIWL